MGLHVAQMTGQDGDARCFDAVTVDAARRSSASTATASRPGCHADFVLLQARDPVEAIRLRATRLAVVRAGRVVATSASSRATLDLPGRPASIEPMPPTSDVRTASPRATQHDGTA